MSIQRERKKVIIPKRKKKTGIKLGWHRIMPRMEHSLFSTANLAEIYFFDAVTDKTVLRICVHGYTDLSLKLASETITHAKFTS